MIHSIVLALLFYPNKWCKLWFLHHILLSWLMHHIVPRQDLNWLMNHIVSASKSYLTEWCILWLLYHDLSLLNDAFYGSCIIILLSWLMHQIVLIMILPNWMIHSIVPASCTLASVIQRPVCGEYLILCSPKYVHNYIHTFINTIWSQFIHNSFLIHSWFIPN